MKKDKTIEKKLELNARLRGSVREEAKKFHRGSTMRSCVMLSGKDKASKRCARKLISKKIADEERS